VLAEHLQGHVALAAPDVQRIVLDPAGLGEDLPEFLLRRARNPPVVVEEDGARAGGALVESEDVRPGWTPQ
jgi:hypothetical protein